MEDEDLVWDFTLHEKIKKRTIKKQYKKTAKKKKKNLSIKIFEFIDKTVLKCNAKDCGIVDKDIDDDVIEISNAADVAANCSNYVEKSSNIIVKDEKSDLVGDIIQVNNDQDGHFSDGSSDASSSAITDDVNVAIADIANKHTNKSVLDEIQGSSSQIDLTLSIDQTQVIENVPVVTEGRIDLDSSTSGNEFILLQSKAISGNVSTPTSNTTKASYFETTYQLARKRKREHLQQRSILNYFANNNNNGKETTKAENKQDKNSNSNSSSKAKKSNKGSKWIESNGKRNCPFYKKVSGTTFCVDSFGYGPITGITGYFLSHFHSDHYYGLDKSFNRMLYCNQITANLVIKTMHVASQFITILPVNQDVVIDDVAVTLLEANHCPGSAMFVFKLRNGTVHLHTGDFRASEEMEKIPVLCNNKIAELYLDTTYCDPSYDFPSQQLVLNYVVSIVTDALSRNTRCLLTCGTYTIGKEKVFLAIAKALNCKIYVQSHKLRTLQCLEIEDFDSLFTSDPEATFLHVLPIWCISNKFLTGYLEKANRYDSVIGFKPTGWTHTGNGTNSLGVSARQYGSVAIYGVPYSEHSSYSELRRFVRYIRPGKIIPTVNVGSAKKRNEMNAIFRQWLS